MNLVSIAKTIRFPKLSFQIVSDLHLEYNGAGAMKDIIPKAENLILAGDIGCPEQCSFSGFMSYVSNNWKNIIYVAGNHEYYDQSGRRTKNRTDELISDTIRQYKNIRFLNNSSCVIDHVKFIGSTLWCDPLGDKNYYTALIHDDYGEISNKTLQSWNHTSINYLRNELENKDTNYINCVITHFLPLMNKDVPNSKYPVREVIDTYFGNKLYDILPLSDAWVSGHTHQSFIIDYYGAKWVCNPYGYKNEIPDKKDMILEL